MKVDGIKTDRISIGSMNVIKFLNKYVGRLAEETVLVFSSKIIGILEGRAVPVGSVGKEELIIRESDAYMDRSVSRYGNMFTINKNTLISAGGIDESNADGHYILWPEDPMKSAARIRDFLTAKSGVKKLGVIISDSTVMPLRRGTVGIMIGWSGFNAVKNLIGTKDLFGREFKVSTVAVGSNLAAAGNTVMGEGNEQTPIAVLTDVPFVGFLDRSYITDAEYKECFVEPEEDLFAPFLLSLNWKKKN
jgi:F420-0:gamma-glutamyl ligase